LHSDQLFGKRLRLSAGWRIAKFDMNIAALKPSTLFEFLLESFYVWIVDAGEHADKPDTLRVLGGRRKRPRCHRTADECDELAPLHVRPKARDTATRSPD